MGFSAVTPIQTRATTLVSFTALGKKYHISEKFLIDYAGLDFLNSLANIVPLWKILYHHNKCSVLVTKGHFRPVNCLRTPQQQT